MGQGRTFGGYGIVYTDGMMGIKVVKTFTQGPSKIINADGSKSYTTPPPIIHELFGGGFTYANGSPVSDRVHLEILPDKMRERALKWFDEGKKVIPQDDVPIRDLEKKEIPEPQWVFSSELERETESFDAKESKGYAKNRERMKAMWANPEFRAKMTGKRKHGKNTTETS